MATSHIETSTASSSPFVFTGVGVAVCVELGLLYFAVLDFYITQALPSPYLVFPILLILGWLFFLAKLRRKISVSRLGIHIADSLMGRLIHERVIYDTAIERVRVELVSGLWYAFMTTQPSGEQAFICFLRANGVAALKLKYALEDSQSVWKE